MGHEGPRMALDEVEGIKVKAGEDSRRLQSIRTRIENARPLKQFSDAVGGFGVFLILEKGFSEKYVILHV